MYMLERLLEQTEKNKGDSSSSSKLVDQEVASYVDAVRDGHLDNLDDDNKLDHFLRSSEKQRQQRPKEPADTETAAEGICETAGLYSSQTLCTWPGCKEVALCCSGNFGGQLVCAKHFKIANS